jgi:hypothetical protein
MDVVLSPLKYFGFWHAIPEGMRNTFNKQLNKVTSDVSSSGDEPHGSLFVYFRIFTLLADDHVIMSHVTSVTQPIPTFSNWLQ